MDSPGIFDLQALFYDMGLEWDFTRPMGGSGWRWSGSDKRIYM